MKQMRFYNNNFLEYIYLKFQFTYDPISYPDKFLVYLWVNTYL